jgi:2-polyprenyl-6-methoxyphenol hydroxylase-like FAD-dependent oxidoreductase
VQARDLVGLASALELARFGIRSTLIEKHASTSSARGPPRVGELAIVLERILGQRFREAISFT